MSAASSLFEDLKRALAVGSNAQRIEMLSRVTDLFITNAHRYSMPQVDLFDEVIAKLAVAIEAKARAKLSIRLADVPTAPAGVVRMLAFDDDIEVAGPVLRASQRLQDADLTANARSKSQLHLDAIAQRKSLSEAVTDILLTRGDRQLAHALAKHAGARFSDAGLRMLVKRSAGDDTLALHLGFRRDLPRQHFLRLLEQASATVRSRLAAEHPALGAALESAVREVADTGKVSSQYSAAAAEVEASKRAGRLDEAEVYRFAREGRFEDTTAALAFLCGVEIDVVKRALHGRGHEIVLILCKLAGFSSTGAKAVLLLRTADRGMSTPDLELALQSYEQLGLETARRVLSFYHTRSKSAAARTALA